MIYVDENLPIGDIEPQFSHRLVSIKRNRDVHAQYEMLNEIGRGKFGRVMKCRHREENRDVFYAAKFVLCMKREDRRNVEREVEIMNKLSDSKLLFLYDAFDNGRNELCLITEYIGGGELFDRVIEDEFVLTEKACAAFMRQIVEGVAFIHDHHIIHLDLKPENIMCMTKTGNRIKIIDFGLARTYEPQKKLQVLFGTPEFVAPEVVAFEPISFATDMWAVGVICYVLLSGLSPFMGDTDLETMANVTIAEYDYEDEAFNNISQEAKNFIDKLLVKEKEKRSSAQQCLQHTWLNLQKFKGIDDERQIVGKQNLSHQRDNKVQEQNYVFDCNSKTMSFATPGVPSAEENLDEEMSDIDNRKRAGDSEVSCETVIQRKRSKTPLDEVDAKSTVAKPVITLDQVKQKADEILEGKRQSQQSIDEFHVGSPSSEDNGQFYTSTVRHDSGDPKMTQPDKSAPTLSLNEKCSTIGLDVVEPTWHATERTLSPMWETATTSTSPEPVCLLRVMNESPAGMSDNNSSSDNIPTVFQANCHVESRILSPIFNENPPQEFVSEAPVSVRILQTISECGEPSNQPLSNPSPNLTNGDNTNSLKSLLDPQTWSTTSSSRTKTESSFENSRSLDSPLNDLLKEVDSQIRSTQSKSISGSAFPPRSSNHYQQLNDVRGDVMQMKNELTALKKDLSHTRRGLETHKKPLMDIINRLDTPKLPHRESNSSYNPGSRISSVKEVVDTQQALEELTRTMTTFKNKGSANELEGSELDNPNIRKVFKSAQTGSVNQVKTRFEQKSPLQEIQQEPVSRILNPRKKSVTPFRTVTRSPSPNPVSPPPPPLSNPSLRRRSPSPVCTGNVSRVRSRFESSSSIQSKNPSTTTSNLYSTNHLTNQTLPKTFKLREGSQSNTSLNNLASQNSNRITGSISTLSDSHRSAFKPVTTTFSNKQMVMSDSPCSPPPLSRSNRSPLDRQSSLPSSTRLMPPRQLSQDLIHGAATFLSQALPVQASTNTGKQKFRGPFGYSDL